MWGPQSFFVIYLCYLSVFNFGKLNEKILFMPRLSTIDTVKFCHQYLVLRPSPTRFIKLRFIFDNFIEVNRIRNDYLNRKPCSSAPSIMHV